MKEIYLVSGLGADKRVFASLDFSPFKTNHIEWVDPLKNETIEHYAKRLIRQIKTPSPILIGVSFGGMVAVEIAKQIDVEKIILISSAKTKYEIPVYFRCAGLLGINKLLPARLFKTVNRASYWLFGTTTKNEKELLRSVIGETDSNFLYWAIDKIVNWRNITALGNLTHIHGTNDKILPLRTADYRIHDGGHLMVISKGRELE